MNNTTQEASYTKPAFFLCLFKVQSSCRQHWMEKSSAEQSDKAHCISRPSSLGHIQQGLGICLPQAHGVTELVTAAPPSLAERSPLDLCLP